MDDSHTASAQHQRSLAQLLVVIVTAIGLFGVAAWASRSSLYGVRSVSTVSGIALAGVLAVLGLIFILVFGFLVLASMRIAVRRDSEAPELLPAAFTPSRVFKVVIILLPVLAVGLILGAVLLVPRSTGGKQQSSLKPHHSSVVPSHSSGGKSSGSDVVWIVVGGAGLSVIATGAAVAGLRRKRRRTDQRDLAHAGLMPPSLIDLSLADLRSEADPRRAVIAAYARMEHLLERAGLPRDFSDGPREYLERALPDLGRHGQSLVRLTGLFERAKFSTESVDENARREAIDALLDIRARARGTT